MNGTGSRSPSCSPLVRMKRIYSSGGSNNGSEEQQQQTEADKSTEKEAEVTENSRLATDLEGTGYSPSAKSEEGEREGKGEGGSDVPSRPEELLSPENLSGRIESPNLNEDSVGGESTSSGSEAVSTPKTTTDRLDWHACV